MEYCTTIGADVSDRTTKICVMTKAEGGERRIARVDMFTSLSTGRTRLANSRVRGRSQVFLPKARSAPPGFCYN